MRNFSPVSEMTKGRDKFWREFRETKQPWSKHKGVTFAHVIALETLNSCITAVLREKYSRQSKTMYASGPLT